MKAQSEYIGFIIALVIIAVLLVPLMFYLINVSAPSSKPLDYQTVADLQINGGSVIIYYNSSNNPRYDSILVYKSNQGFELVGVYYMKNGEILNITNQVEAINNGGVIGSLPQPLIYNFTLPTYTFNYPLILQVNAYNATTFVLLQPNETAVTS